MNRDERIVVVGGGLTGLRAAERLRELKFEGEITILGDEKLPPYHRPALSKQLLKGELRSSDLTLPAYEDLNARWRFGTQVRQLIPNKKTLLLPGGEEMTYDGLIIATGVEATRQSGVPYHDPRVLVLRTMSDGMDLERVLGATKGRVAVIGGGFTGCELAASLRHLSREVTLIGRGKNLLGNVLGPELGEWLTNTHREHGVDLALGNSVEEWNPTSEGVGLKLTDGSTLMVSCVILAAGTKPMTHWLRGSGLPLDNGVVCEPTCHVVGADDVVAAGDVAQWPNLRFDNVPRRVEHWLNAVEMGRAAAENLLAGRENAEPFSPMPRFWTDQYSYRIQAAGMIKLGKDIVKLGTPDEGTGTVYGYSLEGRLMAVSGVDCPTAMISWTESLSRQNPAPKPRVPQEERQQQPITVGGSLQKRPAGKHVAPPKEKQFQRGERRDPEIGYVEQPTPVGVGLGAVVPAGRPQNVVDSFSRMLPVAVRQPQQGLPPMNARPPAARGPVPPPPPPVPPVPPIPPAPPSRAMANTGPFPTPAAPTGPRGPISAPFGDGASSSGLFPAVGGPRGDATPPNGRPMLTPPTGRIPAQKPPADRPREPRFSAAELTEIRSLPEPLHSRANPGNDVTGQMPPLDANGNVHAPEFSDVPPRRGAQDSFGAMPPVRGSQDSFSSLPPVRRGSNGMPVARGPEDSFGGMPPARGPMDSFSSLPPVRRGSNGMPVARGPEDSFGAMPPARGSQDSFSAMPPVRGSQDSFSSLPPVSRGNNGTPRGSEDSFTGLPPARRRTNGTPAARGPEDSFGGMPPARRESGGRRSTGPEESFTGLPPARRATGRGPEDSFGSMPPARRAADNGRPSRGTDDSFSGLPPVLPPIQRESGGRRRAEESFSALPPVARESDSGRAPATRGPESSFSSMPAASLSAEDSFGRMPSVRGPNDPFGDPPPRHGAESSTGGRRRAPEDSFSTMAIEDNHQGAHRAEDLTPDFGVPGKRRKVNPELSSLRLVPALSSMDDSYENLPPARMPKHGRPEDYGFVPSTRPGPEDSYDRMPAVDRPAHSSGGRRRARA
ncbi:FAD-dependent oxidoreductase [Actinophytocola sp.]|uniref:FAD-dependent oxidoreductase n=1 Tax=Actinophytocola sp. TaxID=1872138 RepID=UPI002ECFFFB5